MMSQTAPGHCRNNKKVIDKRKEKKKKKKKKGKPDNYLR